MGLKAETLKDGWGYVHCFRFIPFMSTFGAELPLAEFQVKTDTDTFGDVSTHCKDTSTILLVFCPCPSCLKQWQKWLSTCSQVS